MKKQIGKINRLSQKVLAVLALMTIWCIVAANADEPEKFTIAGIYYFGCDDSHVDEIKSAIPVHVGDTYTSADMKKLKNKVFNAVWQTIRCAPTDVAVITCEHRTWNLYVGLPGRSVKEATYNPQPEKMLELPTEAMSMHDDMMATLADVLSSKGAMIEDDSNGYSLSSDPGLRTKELAFRNWALQNRDLCFTVLKGSSDARQRSVAAEAVGYLDPSQEQIDVLVGASLDSSAVVRNNATRALGCIASSEKSATLQIPADKFVQMLNSGVWTDRNKGEFVVAKLCRRDPAVLKQLRDSGMQALCEMSCWDDAHAGGARYLLAKVANDSPENLKKYWLNGDVNALSTAVEDTNAKNVKTELPPSLADLGIILKEVFLADQSNSTRSYCFEGYKRLQAAAPSFKGTKLEPEYLYSLSFEMFHMGQFECLENKNEQEAIKDFEHSLDHSEASRAAWEARHEKYQVLGQEKWASYVRATIAYLKNDLAQLELLRNKSDSEKVLDRLITGLKEHGKPDYSRDYAGR